MAGKVTRRLSTTDGTVNARGDSTREPTRGRYAGCRLRNPMICSSLYLLFFMSVILHKLTDFSTFSSIAWHGLEGAGHMH